MTEKPEERLLAIARLVRDRDLTDLAAKQQEKHRYAKLRSDFAVQAKEENEAAPGNLAFRRDAENARMMWRDKELYALSHYEARAAAVSETQKRVAARSFGRALALERLLSKMGSRRPG
ncbi:MAG: hypothetical protein AAGP08_13645 [Pseudomonadota bacterium]